MRCTSLKLYRRRRFRCYIINHPIHMLYLIDNPYRYDIQHIIRYLRPITGHPIY